jgi:AcrR family transcriptional regulator
MQEVQKTTASASASLRARKRAETHARIQAAALRLFLERGFEATTMDDIARAADVSRRSLFHYFASKEEIVFSAKADFPDHLRQAVAGRPADEPLFDMVENALVDMARRHLSAQTRDLARLIRDTPALRAGDQAKYEKVERVLAEALAGRKGLPETDIRCRVAAAAAIALLKLATAAWLDGDEASPESDGRAAFAALKAMVR